MWMKFASIIALTPMLLHSILGCCWHHVHGCSCAVNASITSLLDSDDLSSQSSCCACHHEHGNGHTTCCENSHLPAPCDSHHESPCCEVHCVYMTNAPAEVPSSASESGYWGAVAELSPRIAHGLANVSHSSRAESIDPERLLAPAVRLSLLQIWLI